MKVIGVTGSIATGKSTLSAMLRQFTIPVFDADAYVHRLMQPNGEAFNDIKNLFPDVIKNGQINRGKLGALVFQDAQKLQRLEALLHPKVRAAEIAFIKRQHMNHSRICVLDIPLLYETGAERLCDEVWVTYCPDFLQRQRIMSRAGMTPQKCEQVLARQMPQAEKKACADILVSSGLGKGAMMRRVKQMLGRDR
jgi:dephospho-CoA kinase